MVRRIIAVLMCFLINARIALADVVAGDSETGSDKLDGAIYWVGQGARVVGVFGLVFGFWQLGLSFANDEPGDRNKALMFLMAGLILFWTPSILVLFMHWNIIDPSKW